MPSGTGISQKDIDALDYLINDYADRWKNSKSFIERYLIRKRFGREEAFRGIKKEPLLSECWERVVKNGNDILIY